MTHIEHSVIIKAPVELVFKYAADYQKWTEWFEGVSDFKPTTAVTHGNGTRYAYKARMMGVTVRVETEIHDFVQNAGWRGVSTRGMPHRTQWIFESVKQGTKFTYALEYNIPVPLLGRLLDSAFTKPQWDQIIKKSLSNLEAHFAARAHPVE